MVVVAIIGLLSAIAIPNFVSARELSREKRCINALRQIHGAKDLYALETGVGSGAPCDMATIAPYLKAVPVCPVGETPYLVLPIGQVPQCDSTSGPQHNAEYLTP